MSDKILLRAMRGERVERTPVWLMRQAGRVLPEYRALKEQHGFIKMASTPDLAAEVTLQPIHRFGWDGAILFADILTPLMPLSFGIDFAPGPVLERPLQGTDDLDRIHSPDPSAIAHVPQALRLIKEKLPDSCSLLGFAGAPFTLAAYLLDGGGSREHARLRQAVYRGDRFFGELMERLADVTIDYLSIQIEAGAEAVQLFDTWAGILDATTWRRHVLPSVQRVFEGIGTSVPRIYLVKDGAHLLESLPETGADVLSLDWRIPLDRARAELGDMPVQGNLDPGALMGSPEEVKKATLGVLDANAGRPGHIFNLGHGLIPQIPLKALKIMKDTITSYDSVKKQDA